MAKELRVGIKYKTLVDDDIYDYLSKFTWKHDGRYVFRNYLEDGKRKKVYLQRVVNNTPEGMETDHINGDKLDNRRENLRSATRSQNSVNKPKQQNCSSKYKGVCWHKQRSCWKAEIKINGKRKHLGVFLNEYDAAMAYNKAAFDAFGEHVRLN